MRHQIVEGSGIDHHIFSIESESKAIQAPGSRSVQVFTGNMIVRTVTGTFEAHAVIAKRYSTTQVNTPLIQPNPVRAIIIFDDCFRRQLIGKRRSLQRELRSFVKVNDIGFRGLLIEYTCLTDLEITRPGGWKIRFCANCQGSSKLTSQVRIE